MFYGVLRDFSKGAPVFSASPAAVKSLPLARGHEERVWNVAWRPSSSRQGGNKVRIPYHPWEWYMYTYMKTTNINQMQVNIP